MIEKKNSLSLSSITYEPSYLSIIFNTFLIPTPCSSTFDVFVDFISPFSYQCHLDKVFYDENSISYAVMH